MYGNIHTAYKKALHKVLQDKTKSQYLFELLEDFAKNNDNQFESDNSQEFDSLNDEKENNNSTILHIQNLKIHHSKGHPKGTKYLKSAYEISKPMANQYRCKKYSSLGHYQKNCK
ncbi:15230_t:CDS:1, partial [Gigaspora margarita]